jgi:hypothetical protein
MQTMTIPRIVCVLAGGFFLFAVSRCVALLTDRTPHPQLQVTPTEVDLGAVPVGQAVERTFLIRNAGTARLLITDVKSTCQCTVADLPSRAIAPGGLAELKVTFDGPRVPARSRSA